MCTCVHVCMMNWSGVGVGLGLGLGLDIERYPSQSYVESCYQRSGLGKKLEINCLCWMIKPLSSIMDQLVIAFGLNLGVLGYKIWNGLKLLMNPIVL